MTGRLKSITPPTGVVNFQLDKVDLRGRYWLPFFKVGQADFAATYRLTARNASALRHVSVEVRGTLRLRVVGFCTVSMYRRIMAGLIADAVRSEIAQTLTN